METTYAPHSGVGSQVGRLTRDEVLTAAEVADLLQLSLSTVYYLAREGKLPASRLGRTYRFLRPQIQQLLEGEGR